MVATREIMDDKILKETLFALKHQVHPEWGDATLFDVFTRLIARSIGRPTWTEDEHEPINIRDIRSRQEYRTTDELAKLDRHHSRNEPMSVDGPIVVIDYAGQERLIDGTARINLWEEGKNTDRHLVHVHTLSSPWVEE